MKGRLPAVVVVCVAMSWACDVVDCVLLGGDCLLLDGDCSGSSGGGCALLGVGNTPIFSILLFNICSCSIIAFIRSLPVLLAAGHREPTWPLCPFTGSLHVEHTRCRSSPGGGSSRSISGESSSPILVIICTAYILY